MADDDKKYLSDLCDPKKQVWNPFGEYSDVGAEKSAEKTDSLTRFINSCSSNVCGQEFLDYRTGKYVRYSQNCSNGARRNEQGASSQETDSPVANLEL